MRYHVCCELFTGQHEAWPHLRVNGDALMNELMVLRVLSLEPRRDIRRRRCTCQNSLGKPNTPVVEMGGIARPHALGQNLNPGVPQVVTMQLLRKPTLRPAQP